ncbi:MAG: hypothetical protein HN981_02120 [Candidatus Pacebacteria bacterium]|jgi:hypothetical protein|nr:hypothetical protein [Candidatus Paceibacterota bacterium]MBT6921168.1 hypothetical protein [Candidatus Paceibacterota bacterium]
MTSWLDLKLQQEIRGIFEPIYQSTLSDKEVEKIALDITTFMELIVENEYEQNHRKTNPIIL